MPTRYVVFATCFPGSSNGRTAPFGGAYRGSSPRPGALLQPDGTLLFR